MMVNTRNLGSEVPKDNFPSRDMSLSDNKILERGTEGILALRDMFLSDDKILKRGTRLWTNSWGHVPGS